MGWPSEGTAISGGTNDGELPRPRFHQLLNVLKQFSMESFIDPEILSACNGEAVSWLFVEGDLLRRAACVAAELLRAVCPFS